jgi:hypothetical protein
LIPFYAELKQEQDGEMKRPDIIHTPRIDKQVISVDKIYPQKRRKNHKPPPSHLQKEQKATMNKEEEQDRLCHFISLVTTPNLIIVIIILKVPKTPLLLSNAMLTMNFPIFKAAKTLTGQRRRRAGRQRWQRQCGRACRRRR